jgi:hypothetical protein
MKQNSVSWNIISWFLGVLFLVLSVLYAIFIHFIPAGIYLLLSLLYLPPVVRFIKQKTGFGISPIILGILAFFVLWYTLAVGELIEYFE